MELEKASLEIFQRDAQPFHKMNVLFNPSEYRLNTANQFAEVAVPGLESSPLQFVRGNARTLTMKLFFDTYENRTDVREHTRKVTDLLKVDAELHAPPICLFSWGELNFVGVVERADQSFTLFLANGVPVRATIDVTMKEYTEGQRGDRQSADFTKHYVVQRGDTLAAIAGRKYGDPARWRVIAEENELDDPLSIRPGQILVIPAVT